MRLSELVARIKDAKTVGGGVEKIKISGLCMDSRLCKQGDLFFCTRGGRVDSHAYADDAVEAGAVAVVCEEELKLDVPQIIVPDCRAAIGLIATAFYGDPAKKLKIIGVTGTNGKTTITYMLASILRRAGKKVAIVGTLGVFYAQKEIAPELTTPDPICLHEQFADMVKCGVEYVVIEISAHALYYRKDEGINYAACIFSNLSRDHLDFFQNEKQYKSAKKRLFTVDKCPIAILNGDDPVGREIGEQNTNTIYYALDTPADVFAVLTSGDLRGTGFMLNINDKLKRIALPLTGKHNVYNALAAAACADSLGIRMEAIAGGLSGMKPVKGRLEHVIKTNGADIFVDFAHTPDGLEKSLDALKSHCKGRLLCVFGCGGDRDKEKRPLMGEAVARRADFAVLTSDNPRGEDPVDIIAAIEMGYRRFSVRYAVVPEREKAIEYAVGFLKKGDILLVAGKGGEEYQEIMGIKYAYNDEDVIKEIVSRKTS